jgi:hypothetical protein
MKGDSVLWFLSNEEDVIFFYSKIFPFAFFVSGLNAFDRFYIQKLFVKVDSFPEPKAILREWIYYPFNSEPKSSLLKLLTKSSKEQQQIDLAVTLNLDFILHLYESYKILFE